MQNLENLDIFEFLFTQKLLKMSEGPFFQIRAHMHCFIAGKGLSDLTFFQAQVAVEYRRPRQNHLYISL